MIQPCPNCGSPDLNTLEIGETSHDTLIECEDCEEIFREEEVE